MNRFLTLFGGVWIVLVVLLNVASVVAAFLVEPTFWGGLARVQDAYSPYNWASHGLNMLLLAPALGAFAWRNRRRARQASNA